MMPFASDSTETQHLLQRVHGGDAGALDELFAHHRLYLRQMVALHLDANLRRRIDPSDVIQEAQLEATRRMGAYLAEPPMAFRLWLRQITYDRLLMQRRKHSGAARRSVRREAPLPEQSSMQLAQQILADGSTPSEHLVQHELSRRVQQAVAQLPDTDREIILMRNFEGLLNQDVADVLGLDPATASKRYGRALLRLRTALIESGLAESQP
jgi:RNA polymerase sigma-70 factor, ECF subfamily